MKKNVNDVLASLLRAMREVKLPLVDVVNRETLQTKKCPENADEEEFLLLLSDFQVGIKTSTYNMAKFRERMGTLSLNLEKVLALHRQSHPVERLNVFLMGDLVHNENVLRFIDISELEAIVITQIFDCLIPEMTKFFIKTLTLFNEVKVWCVRGNHGNIGKPFSEKTNLDDIAYRFLKQAFSANNRITFYLTDRFYNIAEIQGWKFLIVHGDNISMHMGLPWYGITNYLMRWQGSIGEFNYLCLGHFHNASILDWNGKTIFINGTFLSDDEWVLRRLGFSSSICQLLLGVHKKRGVSFIRKIFLD